MFGRGERQGRSTPWETLGVVVLAVVALTLSVMAFTRNPEPQARGFDDTTSSGTPSTADPSDGTDETPSGEPSEDASASAAPDPVPAVADQRRVDFGNRPDLPDGASTFDNEAVGSPMSVEDGVLQHGRPRGPVAVSSVETELAGDVQKIGARVRFTGDDPGSVVLVAWQSSFVDSRRSGGPIPSTGLRLVATAGSWELTSSPSDEVLASGTFSRVQGTANFELYRSGEQAWVVDPSGATTVVADPRIERFAGPWVCWQLLELEPAMTPAVFESLWAG